MKLASDATRLESSACAPRLWSQDVFGKSKSAQKIMLNLVLGRQAGRVWTRNEWFRTAFIGGTFEWVVDM